MLSLPLGCPLKRLVTISTLNGEVSQYPGYNFYILFPTKRIEDSLKIVDSRSEPENVYNEPAISHIRKQKNKISKTNKYTAKGLKKQPEEEYFDYQKQ